jgi:hypothetical protein
MIEQIHLFAKLPLVDDASSFDVETKAMLIAATIVPLIVMDSDAETDKDREEVRKFMIQTLNHLCKRLWSNPRNASDEYAAFLKESENEETIRKEAGNLIMLLTQLTAIVNGQHPPGIVLNLN